MTTSPNVPPQAADTPLAPAIADHMRTVRHDLHRMPELGFEEQRTASEIANHLRSAGVEVHTGIGGTGVVGILRRGRCDRAIAIRAELDALPITEDNTFAHASTEAGRMHAYGHDGHCAMLLGAAMHLSAHGHFDGTAVFIFQPDEETGRGARAMLADGVFERCPVDAVYALHNLPGLPAGHIAVRPGPIMASEATFEIKLTGVSAHAAMPHRAVDPIVAGAHVVTALQTIVSREVDPAEKAVLSVTDFATSGTRNVIPGEVVITGDARSYAPEVGDLIEAAMRRIATGVAATHRAEAAVTFRREFSPTRNAAREANVIAELAATTFGMGAVTAPCAPLLASDDFGAFLEQRPGAYFFLGNGTEGAHARPLHNAGYDFNDAILNVGASFWVRLVEAELAA